jgi:enoyl-[acyl-carrier protein] reductase I
VCDVNNDEQIKEAGNRIAEYHQGNVNLLAHCIAYAPTFARKASFLDTTRNEFLETQAISTYSLIGITKELYPYMKTVTVPPSSLQSTVDTVSSKSSLSSANVSTPTLSSSSSITTNSIIALSYIGAHRASSTYGIMSTAKASLESTVRSLALDLGKDGVRVNTISAGPIATLASRGIPGFTTMRDETVRKTPLKMNIESKDIGNLATFLASNDASMITGQTIYVDGGFSSVL